MRASIALLVALLFAPQIASANVAASRKTASGVDAENFLAHVEARASQLAESRQEMSSATAEYTADITFDPSGYSDSVNLYAGFKHDPINHRDPTGRILDVLLVGVLYGPEAAAGYLARLAQYGASAAVDAARAVCVPCQLLGNPIRPETELDKDLAAGAAGRLEALNPLNQVARSIAAAQETSGFEKGEQIANAGNAAVDAVLLAVGGARLLYSGAAALSSRLGARHLSLNPEAGRLSLSEVNARPPITDPARLLPARAESLTAARGLTAAEKATAALAGKLQFTGTTAKHMAEAGRYVPRHTLAEAIQSGTRMADPQGAQGAIKIVQEIAVNGKPKTLEIIFREADNTILHFLYK